MTVVAMRGRWLWLLVVGVALAGPAAAQETPELTLPGQEKQEEQARPEPKSQPRQAQPEVVPPERIPERAARSQAFLRQAAAVATPLPVTESVGGQLPATDARLAALDARASVGELATLGERSINSIRQQARAALEIMERWERRLKERSDSLARTRQGVAREMAVWRLTAEALADDDVPAEIAEEAQRNLAALRAVDQDLKTRQDEVLALQARVSNRMAFADEIAERAAAGLEQSRRRVLQRDYPPMWQGLGTAAGQAAYDSVKARLQEELALLAAFLKAQKGRAWLHGLIFLAIVALFALLSRRAQRWIEEDPSLEQVLDPLRHPLAAALVIGPLLTPLIYRYEPLALRELSSIVVIIPAVTILQSRVSRDLRRPLYVVAVLFFLIRLGSLLSAGTALDRLILLVYTLATAVLMWWVFRPGGPATRTVGGIWWATAKLGGRLSLLMLGLSAVLNVLGFVTFAELLTGGVLSSAFIAVLSFAAVLVQQGAVVALTSVRLLRLLNMVRWHGPTIRTWTLRLFSAAALFGWLAGTAAAFRTLEPLVETGRAILFTSASIGNVEISLSDVLAFVVAIWLGLLLARLLRFVLATDVYPRVTLPRGVPATISMLATYTVIAVAFFVAVAAAGMELQNLAIIFGALSVGIGFGLQNIVNNFVSGLILAFERPVQVGDTVEFGTIFGRVTHIGIRSSTVRTWEGAEVIVPNGNLVASEVTNWTLSDRQRRMEVLVGVAYGTNPHKVIELLLETARADERLLKTPEPFAIFNGFGASSLDFSLRAWTDDFDNYLSIKSQLTLAVHDAIKAAGIEIPFPQTDLHLRTVDESAARRLAWRESRPSGGGSASGDSSGTAGSASGAGDASPDAGSPEAASGGDADGAGGVGRGRES